MTQRHQSRDNRVIPCVIVRALLIIEKNYDLSTKSLQSNKKQDRNKSIEKYTNRRYRKSDLLNLRESVKVLVQQEIQYNPTKERKVIR